MSVSCNVFCETCNAEAPELGDGGMMGYPSLADGKEEDGDYVFYNFGWIYSALKSIELLPFEVEAYRAFLVKHEGHKIVQSIGDDEPNIDWDNLKKYVHPKDGFVKAIYEIESESGDKFQTEDFFKKFDEKILLAENIEIIMAKIFDAPSWEESISRTTPSVEPYEDFGNLGPFLRKHSNSRLTVRLIEK